MSTERLQSGCNFWPGARGPWFLSGGVEGDDGSGFDRAEVREGLAQLAEAGFAWVRVALSWEALQPDPVRLRVALLDRLVTLLDGAEAVGLRVQVAVLGRLGGTLFLPSWLLATEPSAGRLAARLPLLAGGWESLVPAANLYERDVLLRAQRRLWAELVDNLGQHPALGAWEPGAGGLLGALPARDGEAALGWWESVAEAAQGATLAYLDGLALLQGERMPSLPTWRTAVGRLDLRASPLHHAVAAGPTDEAWPPFLLLLARTLAEGPVGGTLALPTRPRPALHSPADSAQAAHYPEEGAQAAFFAALLPRLVALGVPRLWHAVWADASTALRALPPYDRAPWLAHAGLLRADGSEKEALASWRTFHAEAAPLGAGRALALDADEWQSRRSDPTFLATLYRRFREEAI